MNKMFKNFVAALMTVMLMCFFNSTHAQEKKVTTKTKTPTSKTKTVVKYPPIKKDNMVRVLIKTDSGIMIIKLYDSTPLHRDNFIKLVKEKFYDSLLFHRIIPEFMIQGGDPLSKNAPSGTMLGSGGGEMTRIPAEFRTSYIHKKGALAAARDGNPEKASSACQFYIVQGKKVTDAELDMMEQRKGMKYTAEQRNIYKTAGGTPFLDQEYTVYGEVVSGMDVIRKIVSAPRDKADRPLGDIHMSMELLK
jgi:cyclophilin family peptidyl-prolyl cis-trans isomerase